MKNSRGTTRTIPGTIELIINSDDPLMVTRYENELICLFVAPIMFFSAAINYVNRYLRLHESFQDVLLDIMVFTILGLMFELFLRTETIPAQEATVDISILLSLVLFFVVGRYYEMMGNSVWTVGFVLIAMSLIRTSRVMLSIVGLSNLVCIIYIILRYGYRGIGVTRFSILVEVSLFVVLFVVSRSVNGMNTSRYAKLRNQKDALMMQKEAIVAAEEELRQQNAMLEMFNEQLAGSEQRLYYLAHHDILTNLPNRKRIIEKLDMLIEQSKTQPMAIYVALIDLDNFKRINDTMGHAFGDLLIQSVAENLRTTIHDEDILGRISGDEFALIVSRKLDEEQALSYVDAIRKALTEPLSIQNRRIHTTASFGISMFPRDGSNAMELFRSADISMYKAKDLGKNSVQFFSRYMKQEMDNKVKIEQCMSNGIRNNEFFLVYQPQHYSSTQELRGFEALLRWNSPEFGILGPRDFMALAEENQLILQLGSWVLETACEKHKMLQDVYNLDTIVSVNVSALQIKQAGFVESVQRALETSRLEPDRLEIEITESVFIDSFRETVTLLGKLKDIGVRIALDDFGTGYFSLSYLRRLPLDTLKIDKSFIDDLEAQNISQKVIGDIISIAHQMDLFVMAEGVEHDHQLTCLTSLNCDGIQGFLLNKPLSEKDLEQMLKSSDKGTYNSSRSSASPQENRSR